MARSRPLGRILVVEDDALLAMSIEDTLREAGAAEIVCCRSIREAMDALAALDPQTIIIDVFLTDRDDGWALAELVNELGPRPPQIIFSTGSPEAIPEHIAELGTVLAKPYHPEQLLDAIVPPREGLFARLRH